MNTPISTGQAWNKLEKNVDATVAALFEEKNLPGMTVAVTKGGRLLLSKGYGYALLDGTRKLPMKPCTRCRIGSVTKAVVTGPSGFQLMKSKNIDPKSQTLYGPKGLFDGIFDADIDIGIKLGIKENKPNAAKWKGWYEKITIQNLLDHKAGFIGSGDVKGAAKMFGVSEDKLTYEQVHRHFLRTKPIYEPGTTPSAELLKELGTNRTYSNHGFGLWTLLISKMSGKSYPDYVREDYLKPMKLHYAVQPEREHPDSCDAWNHKYSADHKPEKFPFEEHGLGLAAGGFRAPSQDLLRLTAAIGKKYTTAQLDSMGWGKNAKGKLAHSGSVGGGVAYVAMYPDGYISSTNVDLSEIHVAVAANIQTGGYALHLMSVATVNALEQSGNNLVIVALVGTKLHVRIFNDHGKRAIDKNENELVSGGTLTALKKRLNPMPKVSDLEDKEKEEIIDDAMSIAGYDSDSLGALAEKIALAVPVSGVPATFDLWKQDKSDCPCEYARHGVPANEYQQVCDEAVEAGYRLEWIDGYTDHGKAHFNVVFRTNEQGVNWASRHNMTGATYQENAEKFLEQGFLLEHVDSYVVGKSIRYAAIWAKGSGAMNAYHGKIADEHQKAFDSLTSQGWRPKVISVASVDGKRVYTALYTRQAIGSFEARSFLTPAEYQVEFDQNKAIGRHLRYLKSYLHNGGLRFSAIWAEQPEISGLQARHGLTSGQFWTSWEDAMSAGFRTRAISGCESDGKVRFAAYWTK